MKVDITLNKKINSKNLASTIIKIRLFFAATVIQQSGIF